VANVISEPIRLLLVISNLSRAGSQRQLLTLAKHIDPNKFHRQVCTLSPSGDLEPEFERAGITITRITKKSKLDFRIFSRFAKLCREQRIEIIYSYLNFDTLVARIGGKLAGVPVIISSERNAFLRLTWTKEFFDRMTRGISDLIISNSYAGRRYLTTKKKIPENKTAVITNGLDPTRLHTDRNQEEVRRHFSIPADAVLVGMIAQHRNEKNFDLFFKVVDIITEKHPDVWFLQVGNAPPTFEKYETWIKKRHQQLQHQSRVIMGESFSDMGALYGDLDILLLTSDCEGFSNVLMEGMATGLPAVVTDAGDNGRMIDNNGGFLVPIKEVEPMTQALSQLITDGELRRQMGECNRKKAVTFFSVERMTSDTEKIILDLYRSKTQNLV
jgi:glycosyltransferase involved in cell wall biosynthesis